MGLPVDKGKILVSDGHSRWKSMQVYDDLPGITLNPLPEDVLGSEFEKEALPGVYYLVFAYLIGIRLGAHGLTWDITDWQTFLMKIEDGLLSRWSLSSPRLAGAENRMVTRQQLKCCQTG